MEKQSTSSTLRTTLTAAAAAFAAYFCMYGFRKPFSVAKFEDEKFFSTDIELKTAIIIGQILGYALSKYIGIKFCSELDSKRRAPTLIGVIVFAHLALLVFAVVPGDWKVAAIFFNGLPLGMVWGLVVRYLEGRRTSDFLLCALCFSFLVAGGVVKDIGLWLINNHNVSESWMPFLTGCILWPPFLVAVTILSRTPEPDKEDILVRVERPKMDGAARWRFFMQLAGGLVPLFLLYFFLTAFRDYRDNYGIEMLTELGYDRDAAVFSRIELPVAVICLLALGCLILVRNSRRSLQLIFSIMIVGSIVLIASNALFVFGMISGFNWMVMIGLGAYLIYVPYNAVLFERMIAATGTVATAVFAIYVADAIGYTGTVGVQLYKDLYAGTSSRLNFFVAFTWLLGVVAIVCLGTAFIYFMQKSKTPDENKVSESRVEGN